MSREPAQPIAVLTGDIVGSSALSADELSEVMAALQLGADAVCEGVGGDLTDASDVWVGPVDVFRGDGWQAALRDPRHALLAAVILRLAVIRRRPEGRRNAFDTRVAIAVGPAERLVPEAISRSSGSAFTQSGGLLDGLGSDRLGFSAASGQAAESLGEILSGWLPLLDLHLTQVSPRQAEALLLRLRRQEASELELAGEIEPPVAPSTLNTLLRRAGGEAVSSALAWYYEAVDRLVENG